MVLCLLAGGLGEAVEPQVSSAGFDKMRTLVGIWKLRNAQTPNAAAFRISYRMISRDTAIVETFGDPAKQTTETIYHRDGQHLMATHYCAQGNQPRLRLQESNTTAKTLVFIFFDATNLASERDSHLVRLRFDFVDAEHLKREEVYSQGGTEESSVVNLERTR